MPITPAEKNYLTTNTELKSIADAIRTKGNTSASLVFPTGFINAIENISTGGGGQLYVLTMVPYATTECSVNGTVKSPSVACAVAEGETITFKTFDDYILDTVTGQTSGDSISFITVTRGEYTFVMPSESVYCKLLYDD